MRRWSDAEVWHAVRFEEVMRAGRTSPLLLECMSRISNPRARKRLVTKAIGLPEVHDFTLAHELIGSRLARLFGLSAPAAHVISIDPDFIEAARPEFAAARLQIEPGLAVGTEFIPDLMPFPIPVRLIDEREVHDAAAIYTFDLLTQNPDRSVKNPNCGRALRGIAVYDFETAFSFRFAVPRHDAWRVAALPFATSHLLNPSLRRASVDWPMVFAPFRQVPASSLAEACSTIPGRWSHIGDEILDHLTSVYDHWSEFEQEITKSLESSS